MQALLVCLRITAFWLIINLANLRSILILKLANIEVSCDNLFLKMQKIQQVIVKINSIAIAQFFHQICTSIFNVLLATNKNQSGIFNQVSNYFDIVKINKRDILYLYFLIWLIDNLEFHNLQFWLQSNAVFITRIIYYLKFIIKYFINLVVENLENLRS